MGKQGTLASKMARGRISLREAAILIGVSYGTALKLQKKGQIRTIRVGSMYMVSMDEVERFNREGNYLQPSPEQIVNAEEAAATEAKRAEDEKRGPSNVPPYLQKFVRGSL